MEHPAWIDVGYVARAHGLRGELRVRLYNPSSTILGEIDTICLEGPKKLPQRTFSVDSFREIGAHGALMLAGVVGRDAAQALVGARVLVSAKQLPSLEDDEFYLYELIGLKAMNTDGVVVGRLTEVYPMAGHDIYVIQGETLGELMVPATPAYVRHLDFDAGTVTLTGLEELMEALK